LYHLVMRWLLAGLILVFTLACQPPTGDEAGLRDTYARLADAWATFDNTTLATIEAPEYTIVGTDGKAYKLPKPRDPDEPWIANAIEYTIDIEIDSLATDGITATAHTRVHYHRLDIEEDTVVKWEGTGRGIDEWRWSGTHWLIRRTTASEPLSLHQADRRPATAEDQERLGQANQLRRINATNDKG
jgi:hypothetical protein